MILLSSRQCLRRLHRGLLWANLGRHSRLPLHQPPTDNQLLWDGKCPIPSAAKQPRVWAVHQAIQPGTDVREVRGASSHSSGDWGVCRDDLEDRGKSALLCWFGVCRIYCIICCHCHRQRGETGECTLYKVLGILRLRSPLTVRFFDCEVHWLWGSLTVLKVNWLWGSYRRVSATTSYHEIWPFDNTRFCKCLTLYLPHTFPDVHTKPMVRDMYNVFALNHSRACNVRDTTLLQNLVTTLLHWHNDVHFSESPNNCHCCWQ